jgi:hypothetical protein
MSIDPRNPRSPHFRAPARTGEYVRGLDRSASAEPAAASALLIDRASAARKVSGDELAQWAAEQSAFISSVMSELAEHRRAVADVLEDAGARPVWFEEFGGRDDDPEDAYRSEVARSDIYLGLIGERYGKKLKTGFSATHEEYEEAIAGGKHISLWVMDPAPDRDGNANRFLDDLRLFHTYGRFSGPSDLAQRVRDRLAEMAADDLSPWVKLGDTVFRADEIESAGRVVRIRATIRDGDIRHFLDGLGESQWGQPRVGVTFFDTTGEAQVENVQFSARSAGLLTYTLDLSVETGQGRSMRSGMGGQTPDDLVELGVRAGLLGEPLPEEYGSGFYGGFVPSDDPLAPLVGATLPEGSFEPIARLLLVEAYVSAGHIGRIRDFRLGPRHAGERAVSLEWVEPHVSANQHPGQRRVEGKRQGP